MDHTLHRDHPCAVIYRRLHFYQVTISCPYGLPGDQGGIFAFTQPSAIGDLGSVW